MDMIAAKMPRHVWNWWYSKLDPMYDGDDNEHNFSNGQNQKQWLKCEEQNIMMNMVLCEIERAEIDRWI